MKSEMKVTKLLVFLLLFMILVRKETKAISTELFACPSAKVLKNGEFLIGYRLIDRIYLRIGILNFLETEGLISIGDIYSSLKLVLLKEKENLPQIAFVLNQGRGNWFFEHAYSINSSGLVFSKKIKDYQVNASIFKGSPPSIIGGGNAYHNEKYSFHTSLERSLNNLKLIVELHNFFPRRNILIGGLIYKAKRFNFKLGHGFVKEKDEIKHIFPFLNIEYERRIYL